MLITCALTLVLPVGGVIAYANGIDSLSDKSTADSGYCGGESDGKNLTWTLSDDGTLTVSGSGTMADWVINDISGDVRAAVISEGVTSIGEWAFYGCESLLSVTIPKSVTAIGSHAFGGCTSLELVSISAGVTVIGDLAFEDCTGLREISVDSRNTSYLSLEGVLFTADSKKLIQYPAARQAKTYSIPEGVEIIDECAFLNSTGLAVADIPNSTKLIDSGAFGGCTALESVSLPESVTAIGSYAFSDCASLAEAEMADGIAAIESGAFAGCTGLTAITIPGGVASMGGIAFYGCANLTDIYCEAEKIHSEWDNGWLKACSATVHWGCKPPAAGDINGDGKLDKLDLELILNHIKGIAHLTAEQQTAADTDGNGWVDISDYNRIFRQTLL